MAASVVGALVAGAAGEDDPPLQAAATSAAARATTVQRARAFTAPVYQPHGRRSSAERQLGAVASDGPATRPLVRLPHAMKRALALATIGFLGVAAAPASAAPATLTWPGGAWTAADRDDALGGNLSGLAVAGPNAVWAVRDGPSALLRLQRREGDWVPATGWEDGRALTYPDGDGGPDAEGVTTVVGDDGAVYVGAERDNDGGGSRNSILRYDTAGSGRLKATAEWDLTDLLPSTPANTGIEGVAWVPDADLVTLGLRGADGAAYDPATRPGHGPGLFVVALERTASLYAVALFDGGRAELVASTPTGLDAVMEVSWNAERRELWALCDDACDGRAAVFVPGTGAFTPAVYVDPPAGLGAFNDEGFAVLPGCTGGATLAVWSDDGASNGHAIREASLPCTALLASAATASSTSSTTTARPTTSSAPRSTTAATTSTTASPPTTAAAPPTTAPSATTVDATSDGGGSGGSIVVIAVAAMAAVAAAGAVVRTRRRR